MGYAGKLEEKKLALELRAKGLSYSEIQKKVPVSKDTLSRWCRDVILSPKQLEKLRKKKLKGAERGRIIGAKRQQQARLKEIKRLRDEGIRNIGKMNKRDRFIAGCALYLGDGSKSENEVGFSNSNSNIIKFMMKWFREFCKVPEKKFRGAIWIHDNLDQNQAKIYWSNLTNIPPTQFHKTYVAKNKTGSRKIRKKRHEHGVFAIRISDASLQRKLLGWMAGILEG